MRVLQLCHGFNHLILPWVSAELSSAGHHTVLLSGGRLDLMRLKLADSLFDIPQLVDPTREGRMAAAERVSEFCKEWRPDVLLYHEPEDGPVYESLSARYPIVGFVHTPICPGGKVFRRNDAECTKPLNWGCMWHWYVGPCGSTRNPGESARLLSKRLRNKRTLRRMETILVASHFMRRHLIGEGVPAHRTVVVSIDCPEEHGVAEVQETRINEIEQDLVLYVGRLSEHKGIHHLLQALRLLDRDHIRLVVVGQGYFEPKLRAMVRELGLRRVEFVGEQTPAEVVTWYRKARLLVVPSVVPEGLGLVVAEAALKGLPALVSDRGALPEWVERVPGTELVAVTDTRALADAVDRAMHRPLLRVPLKRLPPLPGAVPLPVALERIVFEQVRSI